MQERRSQRRFSLRLPCQITLSETVPETAPQIAIEIAPEIATDNSSFQMETLNISCGGAYLRTATPLAVGTCIDLDVWIQFPADLNCTANGSCLHLHAEILRSDPEGMAVVFNGSYRIAGIQKLISLSRSQTQWSGQPLSLVLDNELLKDRPDIIEFLSIMAEPFEGRHRPPNPKILFRQLGNGVKAVVDSLLTLSNRLPTKSIDPVILNSIRSGMNSII